MQFHFKSLPVCLGLLRLFGVLALLSLVAACGQSDDTDEDDKAADDSATVESRESSEALPEIEQLEEIELLPDGSLRQIEEPEPLDTEALLAAIRASDAELAAAPVAPKGLPTITTLRALDKITARVSELEAEQDQEVRFGTLAITARTCRSRPPEETPETFAFLEIDDVNTSGERTRVFSGWMLASSPALNPLEHAVYDVWVIACRTAEGSSVDSE